MSDREEPLTLLDKATEDDSIIYVRCPTSKIEDIAADMILSKLDKLRRVEEIIGDGLMCCKFCDARMLAKIKEVVK